jgi:hypothetical protein
LTRAVLQLFEAMAEARKELDVEEEGRETASEQVRLPAADLKGR